VTDGGMMVSRGKEEELGELSAVAQLLLLNRSHITGREPEKPVLKSMARCLANKLYN
jgi:hypothetical protein